MQQNRFNQLPKYENIFSSFKEVLNQYLKLAGGKRVYNFNISTKKLNDSGFKNDLIEDDFMPFELVKEVKDSYLSRDYLKGEVGLIDSQDQYDGIFNISLYALMTNRLGKLYKSQFDRNSTCDDNTRNAYKELYKKMMTQKKDAMTKLIYSLFIYKETENDDDFFYGYRADDYGNSSFVIDLPVYGQISLHFGSEENLENIKYIAKQNIDLILAKKLELGQITEKQFLEIKGKADNGDILPTYKGKLYEYTSGIPLDYCGRSFEMAQKDLNLSHKMVTDITNEDIKNISNNKKYNSRELYFFAIKSDFSKSQLENLSQYLQARDIIAAKSDSDKISSTINVQTLGRRAVILTSAQERSTVNNHENIRDSHVRNNIMEK